MRFTTVHLFCGFHKVAKKKKIKIILSHILFILYMFKCKCSSFYTSLCEDNYETKKITFSCIWCHHAFLKQHTSCVHVPVNEISSD